MKLSDDRKTLIEVKEGDIDNVGEFHFPEGVTLIENCAFENLCRLKRIRIPDEITVIGFHAFRGCYNLVEVNLPARLTKIWPQAFDGCSNLLEITLPKSVGRISDQAFKDCSRLRKVTILGDSIDFGGGIFWNCSSLVEINYPEQNLTIAHELFWGCDSLCQFKIPSKVKKVDWRAFANCRKLNQMTIPKTVRSISGEAFGNCSSLGQITLPEGLEKIDDDAFIGCTDLKNIFIVSDNEEKYLRVKALLPVELQTIAIRVSSKIIDIQNSTANRLMREPALFPFGNKIRLPIELFEIINQFRSDSNHPAIRECLQEFRCIPIPLEDDIEAYKQKIEDVFDAFIRTSFWKYRKDETIDYFVQLGRLFEKENRNCFFYQENEASPEILEQIIEKLKCLHRYGYKERVEVSPSERAIINSQKVQSILKAFDLEAQVNNCMLSSRNCMSVITQ